MRFITLSACPLAILSICLLAGCAQQQSTDWPVAAAARGEDTTEVTQTTDGTAVLVANPRGFGSVRITRQAANWPPLLAVRLVYSAQKEFQTVHALTVRVSGRTGEDDVMEGRTSGLGTRDVLFFNVGAGAGGFRDSYRIDIQHRARYLQITIPPELLKRAGNWIELSWVDQM